MLMLHTSKISVPWHPNLRLLQQLHCVACRGVDISSTSNHGLIMCVNMCDILVAPKRKREITLFITLQNNMGDGYNHGLMVCMCVTLRFLQRERERDRYNLLYYTSKQCVCGDIPKWDYCSSCTVLHLGGWISLPAFPVSAERERER